MWGRAGEEIVKICEETASAGRATEESFAEEVRAMMENAVIDPEDYDIEDIYTLPANDMMTILNVLLIEQYVR